MSDSSDRRAQSPVQSDNLKSRSFHRQRLFQLGIADKDISINYISHYLGHVSTMVTGKYCIGPLPEQVKESDSQELRVISE